MHGYNLQPIPEPQHGELKVLKHGQCELFAVVRRVKEAVSEPFAAFVCETWAWRFQGLGAAFLGPRIRK